jgi:hypothetical protein
MRGQLGLRSSSRQRLLGTRPAPRQSFNSKAFAGGKKYTFIRGALQHTSLNLTPDATGLRDWTIDDIVATLKTNTAKGSGPELCNTHPGGTERLGKMTMADMRDIATYIHTLPPIKNGPFRCM